MDHNNLPIIQSSGINPVSTVHTQPVSTAQTGENIDFVDRKKQELCEKLKITSDEYTQIVGADPDFPNKPFDEQLEIVRKNKVSKLSTPTQIEAVEQNNTDSVLDFTYENYRKSDLDKKTEYCYAELARNYFIYGLKDKDGKVIIEPHSEQAWVSMSGDDKLAFIANFESKLKSNEKFAEIQAKIESKTNRMPEALTDTTARAIQVANSLGMSFTDFLKLPEAQRIDATEKYLNGLRNDNVVLNDTDSRYLERQNAFRTLTSSILKERYGIELPADISASELDRCFNDYNLNGTEEMYNYFSSIVEDPEATDAEKSKAKRFLKDNELLVTTSAGKDIINKSKAANLLKLKADFDILQQKVNSGETLTPEEQSRYEHLGKYLSSDEAKSLQEITSHLPQPHDDYENRVVQDITDFRNGIKGVINDEHVERAAIIEFIENQTQGMSAEEKEKYIATFLTFNNDTTSVTVLKYFGDKIPTLYDNKYLISEGSLNIETVSDEGAANLYQNIQEQQEAGNPYATNAALTAGEILDSPACLSPDNDFKKDRFVSLATIFTDARVQTKGFDVATTITDTELQGRSVATLQNCDNATDELQCYVADNADKLQAPNQNSALRTATTKSAKATAIASTNNIVARLAKENQVEGASIVKDSIDLHYEGDDAIKYHNALSDQNQYCDKDNQLAIHDMMMNSKYSEVQEHVAGNIKNYDPSVQPDAMSSVFRSGNRGAIEVAVSSISEFKSPDVQQIVLKQAVMELANSDELTNVLEKFANGTLTNAEIANLSPAQRREYYVGLFDKASPADKIKFLKEIPDGRNKQTVYNLIGTYYKNLFIQMVQDDVQTAETMFNMGLKPQLHSIIENCIVDKAETDPSFKFLRDRLKLTSEEEYPQTARTVSYSSVPGGFNNEKFNLFGKDKYGNLLA